MNFKTVQFVTFKLLTSTQPHNLHNYESCKRHNDILIASTVGGTLCHQVIFMKMS